MNADPERFHIVAPHNTDPRQWTKLRWTDIYSRKTYRISTTAAAGSEDIVRVKTYGEVKWPQLVSRPFILVGAPSKWYTRGPIADGRPQSKWPDSR